LDASKEGVGNLGVIDDEIVGAIDGDPRGRNASRERADRGDEIHSWRRLDRAHDPPDFGESLAGQRVGSSHRLRGGAVGELPRELELETERREVVPQAIVQLARDAKTFALSTSFDEERL